MPISEILLAILMTYSVIGAVFSVVFAVYGVTRVDEAAIGSSIWFRLLIIPGGALLWPVLLFKWLKVNQDK